jgi:hypothetical protein
MGGIQMNIMVQTDACKISANYSGILVKSEFAKVVTVDVGKTILPDLLINKNEMQDSQPTKNTVDEYNELL